MEFDRTHSVETVKNPSFSLQEEMLLYGGSYWLRVLSIYGQLTLAKLFVPHPRKDLFELTIDELNCLTSNPARFAEMGKGFASRLERSLASARSPGLSF